MSFPFIVRQRALPARAIILRGRSLPYRPVAWGGTQRLDVNWFPGNPVAVIQVIGATLKPTSITGMWKDIFLSDSTNRATLINFPALTAAARPDATERGGTTFKGGTSMPAQFAERARVLRDAFELLRTEGVLLQVEWGSIVRYGQISDTNFPHEREEDISFEMEFTWSGVTDSQPRRILPSPDLLGFVKRLFALLDRALNTLIAAVIKAEVFLRTVTQAITKIGSFVTEMLATLDRIAQFAFAPADVFGTLLANHKAIQLAILDFFDTLSEAAPAALEAARFGNAADIAAAMTFEQTLRRQLTDIASESAKQQADLEELQVPELLGVIVSQGNMTLRDVSLRFYGTTNNWTEIAAFNGFSGSMLPRGTVVRIPALS